MMTTARVAADTTEFIRTNFHELVVGTTELWDNGAITVTGTVILPVGNLQARIATIAEGKTIAVQMTLCADSLLTTTALYDQTEIRPEELDGYLAYHKEALMGLAAEYAERATVADYDACWIIPLTPDGEELPF